MLFRLVLLLHVSAAEITSAKANLHRKTKVEDTEVHGDFRQFLVKFEEQESKIDKGFELRKKDKREIDSLSKTVESLLEYGKNAENRIYYLEREINELKLQRNQDKIRIQSLEETISQHSQLMVIQKAKLQPPLNTNKNQNETLREKYTQRQTKTNEMRTQYEHMYGKAVEQISFRRQLAEASGAAFTACVSVMDIYNFGEHQTVIFDKAITNVGNHYHTSTGIFTAPYSGVYVFHVTAMVNGGKEVYLEIIKDGVYIDDMQANASGDPGEDSTSEMWVLKLSAGEEVWIRNGYHNNNELHGNCFTAFTGFLLYYTD